jgi:ubiquinone biosynthesis protein
VSDRNIRMSAVSTMVKNVQGLRTAIGDMGRMRQITTILTRHGFGALLGQMKLQELPGLGPVLKGTTVLPSDRSLAETVRIALEELGPTFVKLGQILSTRSDLLNSDFIREFEKLQDDVPPIPADILEPHVEHALGQPIADMFDYFDMKPLACASIAQVHRATLFSGRDVVVKILRPDITKSIISDLNILEFLADQAAQWVTELKLLDPVGVVKEFERAISRELDFTYEFANIKRFRNNFDGFEGIFIPQVYAETSNSQLLTMEFVEGVKVTEAPEHFGSDPHALCSRMLQALFQMVFVDGFFHGDMHPGNILVTKDHTIALIDFGLVGRLLPRQREAILDLLIGVSKEDHELITRVVFDLGIKSPGIHYDYTTFEVDVIDVMENHIAGKTLKEIDIQAFFRELVSGALKHKIQMPPTYTMVFKALMTAEGIGKTLAPELHFIEEARPFIKELLLNRYHPQRWLRETMETLSSTSKSLRIMSQTAPRLLRDLELGRLAFEIDSKRFDDLAEELQRSTNRILRALVFGSASVAGTLALEINTSTVFEIPTLSFVAYTIAAIAGFPLMFSLVSRK